MVTKEGRYIILQQEKHGNTWRVMDQITKEIHEMDLIKDVASMRYLGQFGSEEEAGFNKISHCGLKQRERRCKTFRFHLQMPLLLGQSLSLQLGTLRRILSRTRIGTS